MHGGRCSCAECRALDALPERLQGWPGAWQSSWFKVRRPIKENETLSLPTFDDPRVAEACRARCADFGDPACYELNGSGPIAAPYCNKPCGECLRDVGVEPGDEFDENAAVGRLV